MAGQWFYAANGSQAGPVDTAELKRLAGEGALEPTDLVWKEGLPEWVPATKVKGLFASGEPEAGAAAPQPLAGTTAEGSPAAYDPAPLADAPGASPLPEYASPTSMLAYQSGGGMTETASPRTIELLRQTRPWVLLFSVLMFIVAGLMFLGGLAMAGIGLIGGRGAMSIAAIGGVVYVLGGMLYFFPALYLGRYGSRIGSLAVTRRTDTLESALEAQKSFWKFLGVATLVVIGLYVALIVVVLIIGVAAGGM